MEYKRLKNIFGGMKTRCYNKKDKRYPDYGGRGIQICREWMKSYHLFEKWALENGYSDELSIDRINNNGNYEPSNCRWATQKEQSNNGRHNVVIKYKGEVKTLVEWVETLELSYSMVSKRLINGNTIKEAFTRPPQKKNEK